MQIRVLKYTKISKAQGGGSMNDVKRGGGYRIIDCLHFEL